MKAIGLTWRRGYAFLVLLSGLCSPQFSAWASDAPKPNILLILTDDVGWGDFQGYNPAGKIPSPNVDRLAREGMRFMHAHTPTARGAPTRYTISRK